MKNRVSRLLQIGQNVLSICLQLYHNILICESPVSGIYGLIDQLHLMINGAGFSFNALTKNQPT